MKTMTMMSFSGAGLQLRRSRTPPFSVSLLWPIHLDSDFSVRNWTTNRPISRSQIFAFWEFEDRVSRSSRTETCAWRNWIDPNCNRRSDSRPWKNRVPTYEENRDPIMKKCWFVARRRRKEKEEREGGKRERESSWCLGLEVDMSLTRVPQRCMYLHYCHRYSFFRNWKQLKVVFNFRDSNSIFWELSYENWARKLIQTKQVFVGPTKFRNWVIKIEYWMMKTLKPNMPLVAGPLSPITGPVAPTIGPTTPCLTNDQATACFWIIFYQIFKGKTFSSLVKFYNEINMVKC